jgi:hypothetical protein
VGLSIRIEYGASGSQARKTSPCFIDHFGPIFAIHWTAESLGAQTHCLLARVETRSDLLL